jgi:hypothetical protein
MVFETKEPLKKMEISPGWLTQNIFLNKKRQAK